MFRPANEAVDNRLRCQLSKLNSTPLF